MGVNSMSARPALDPLVSRTLSGSQFNFKSRCKPGPKKKVKNTLGYVFKMIYIPPDTNEFLFFHVHENA